MSMNEKRNGVELESLYLSPVSGSWVYAPVKDKHEIKRWQFCSALHLFLAGVRMIANVDIIVLVVSPSSPL